MTALNQIANAANLIEVNTTTPDVFDASVANELVSRYEKISPNLKGGWGKMNAGQMLKHVADNAEMEFGDTH